MEGHDVELRLRRGAPLVVLGVGHDQVARWCAGVARRRDDRTDLAAACSLAVGADRRHLVGVRLARDQGAVGVGPGRRGDRGQQDLGPGRDVGAPAIDVIRSDRAAPVVRLVPGQVDGAASEDGRQAHRRRWLGADRVEGAEQRPAAHLAGDARHGGAAVGAAVHAGADAAVGEGPQDPSPPVDRDVVEVEQIPAASAGGTETADRAALHRVVGRGECRRPGVAAVVGDRQVQVPHRRDARIVPLDVSGTGVGRPQEGDGGPIHIARDDLREDGVVQPESGADVTDIRPGVAPAVRHGHLHVPAVFVPEIKRAVGTDTDRRVGGADGLRARDRPDLPGHSGVR